MGRGGGANCHAESAAEGGRYPGRALQEERAVEVRYATSITPN